MPQIDVKDFQLRTMSAVIIAPVVLLAVYVGGSIYASRLHNLRRHRPVGNGCISPTRKRKATWFFFPTQPCCSPSAWAHGNRRLWARLFGAALLTGIYFVSEPTYKERTQWIVLGLPYTAGFALSLIYLRATPHGGMALVFYLLAVVWGTDIGAYVAGRLIGGPKLARRISPNKTWAGFYGGIILAAICGYSVARGFGAQIAVVGLLLAPALSIVSQAGDLFESWMKRRAKVKESSNLIPGHGGVLDRIDGLIFCGYFPRLVSGIWRRAHGLVVSHN